MTNKSPYGNSINDFEVLEKIGSGGFAEVFKARCLLPGLENTYVAIKKISKIHIEKRKCRDKIVREIDIHSHLPSHPAFVKFHTSFEDSKYWYLVLELCAGGSFEDYIKKKHHLSEEEAARLIEQVIHGVQCLHHCLIIHRDLSLRNLLLTENHDVKIADFGLAMKLKHYDEKTNTVLGTANFMSPEVFNHDLYDYKADCWSVGCVLYALLYGAPPFNDKKREQIMKGVVHSTLVFPDYASSEAKELLMDMLNKDQTKRIEFNSALKYAFFQKYKKSNQKCKSSYKKSSDSGMSSYSSSGSHHRSDKEKKIKKTQNASTSVSRYNSLQDILSESQKHNYLSPISTSCRSSPIINDQLKTKFQTLPTRLESQINTPIKKYPECPKYPSALNYLARKDVSSHIYSSDQHSVFNDTRFERKSSSTNHLIVDGQNSYVGTKCSEETTTRGPSCSHIEYCPSDSCIHKLSCCCRRQQNSSHHLYENSLKENRYCIQTENIVVKKCLKDIVTPLNTSRLNSRRKEFEKTDKVVSILNDGQVCLEFFKLRKGKKLLYRVYFISQDGFQITIYKPKKKIPLNPDKPPYITNDESEVQYFTYENLPEIHWKKYQFAKYFVDMVRRITPKVTVHGEHGTCIMMENSPNPNFEMNFYDGFQLIESTQKKTIKDKNGVIVTNENENTNFMLTEFESMKKQCFKIENIVETYLNSYFPITCKKKPEDYKRSVCQDSDKENIRHSSAFNKQPSNIRHSSTHNKQASDIKHSSTLNKQALVAKPRDVIITVDHNSCENSHRKNESFMQSNVKNYYSRNERSYLSHWTSFKVINDWIVTDYEDGIQMYISMQNNTFRFRDIHTQEWLPNIEYPHLQSRYDRDSQDILRQALFEEVKRKT